MRSATAVQGDSSSQSGWCSPRRRSMRASSCGGCHRDFSFGAPAEGEPFVASRWRGGAVGQCDVHTRTCYVLSYRVVSMFSAAEAAPSSGDPGRLRRRVRPSMPAMPSGAPPVWGAPGRKSRAARRRAVGPYHRTAAPPLAARSYRPPRPLGARSRPPVAVADPEP